MFKISYDKKITMVQGDTGVIRMKIHNYELSQGDEVRFAIVNKAAPSILLCQHSDKKIVLEKQVTVFEKNGSARIVIHPDDTEYLQPGKYLYEIQVKTKDGRIDTVVPLASFTLMDGSIQGEFGQITPSKPELTPSEIELRFKRLENEIIPELGNRITNVENEIDSVSSSLDDMKNVKDGERINAKHPPQGYKGIEENEDITEVLNTLLNNFSHVFIPNGNYILNGTINVPNDTHLEMELNTKIKVINNLPVIKLNNRTKVCGGFIDIPSNHNTGVIFLTGISNYNEVSNIKMTQNTKSNPNPEIGTAIGIYFDARNEEYDINNCYQMFNNFDKIQIDWCGYVVKHDINSKPYSNAPWCTANNFTNISAWHTHQIVDVACSFGGNIFNNIITQCGMYDTLLYKIDGGINHFTNLIYYDLPSNCTIVEFTENSRLNLFHLWFEREGGFSPKYINKGNKNTITKLGGFLESPIDLVMENGWQHKNDSDVNVQKAQCYKNNLKEVKLRGRVVGGPANQVIATLPVGYRPPKHTFFAVPTSDRTIGVITILYTGAIIAYGQEKMDFTLDGISFRVDV